MIRDMVPADWADVRRIYEDGIASGDGTFDLEAPDWATWDAAHLPDGRWVWDDGGVQGWLALTPYSSRDCYRGVVEHSVYVAAAARGRGIGRALLTHLVSSSAVMGFWTLQAGIFPENEASLHLHRSLGFRVVGTRERLGQMHGVWRDVVLLERRA